MFKGLAVIATVLLMTMSSAYAKACYTPQEAEAEQGLRIHSELMVIGLNCQHMTPPGVENFYAQYRKFTSRYEDLFADYEARLINYFKNNGSANSVSSLNDLRTDFANKISQDAATMRPDIFCARYINRLERAVKMDRPKLVQWSSTIFPSHPVSRPVCK